MDLPPSISVVSSRPRRVVWCGAVALAMIAAACGSDAPETARTAVETSSSITTSDAPPTTASTTQAPTTTVSSTTTLAESTATEPADVVAFNGRAIPPTVDNPQDAAELFTEVARGLRVDDQQAEIYADLGHTQQVLIRTIMRNPDWIEPFRADIPADLLTAVDLHIEARTELGKLHSGWTPTDNVPAWAIIEPEPLDTLVAHYKSASEETGIEWQILAGINLIETGMGRIDGLSSAGAQGPMQFLPTTWEEVSEGGDVTDPEDAIHGAARYLVRRGGLDDIRAGLWGYNNSDHYVNAVLAYAEMVKLDERTLRGFYNWEIYIGSAEGTLWLPVGFSSTEVGSAKEYLAENPWAKTLG